MDVTYSLDLKSVSFFPTLPAKIYRGRFRNGTAAAIKPPEDVSHKGMLEVLAIWDKCSHQNVVQLVGTTTFREKLSAVYEWHEYEYIYQYLKHHPTVDRYQLCAQISEGVAYLHANGIIHGDLHAHQILVSSDGVPRIELSIGISCTTMHPTRYYGATHWTAPELFNNGAKCSLAGDIFGLGMTILGTIIWYDAIGIRSASAVFQQVWKGGSPSRPTNVIPMNDAGNLIWDILCKCWSLNPKNRPSANDVCDVMGRVFQTPDGVALKELRTVVTEATKTESPRPSNGISMNDAGNLIWDMLCKCWSFCPQYRPSVKNVWDVMGQMFQTPDGVALNSKELKKTVTEETSIEDLVAHYEKQRLTNYTKLLLRTSIATATPFADTALANVYKITLPNQQCIAVKCVKHTAPHKKLKRAARELSCWSTYQHENILPVLGFAVVKGDLAMVSQWMDKGCIREYVISNPRCDRLALCTQLARAIAYLHEQSVVHGDIKGPNVLVSDAGSVKITDFGVSITDHQEIEFSGTSAGRGTHRWQAPEILLGQSDSTKEADVYALGMTMIEIYTGEQPYGSTNWFQLMRPIIHDELRPSRPILLPIDKIGNGVWGVIKFCWFTDPSKRVTSTRAHEWLQYYSSTRN